jgi:hypothetical protein
VSLVKRGWKFLKANPLFNGFFIFIIAVGILMISLVQIVGFSSSSETDSVEGNSLGVGHGQTVKKGDIIYAEYEIKGEDVDVFLITGYWMPFGEDDDNVLLYRPNATSGSMTYEVKEDEMHMIYFKGKDFNYSYTFRVDKPLFSLIITIAGFVLIGIGLLAMWHIPRVPNPRYLGNSMKYISIILVISGIGFLGVVLVYPIREFYTYFFPFYLMIYGLEYLYLGRTYNKQYMIRCLEKPNDCSDKINTILDKKGIKYQRKNSVKEKRTKWDTIFDFEGTDIKIMVRKLYFQEDKTLILIGRKNPVNGSILAQLANDIAKDQGCRNYKPVSN